MATFTIPSTLISANAERQSPGQAVPSTISQATVTLVDTNTQWGSVIDNARHIKCWGLQLSRDGGATWLWWLFTGDTHDSPTLVNGEPQPRPADATLWMPFGFRDKTGGMPWIKVESSAVIEAAGAQVRLAVLTDAQVRLGATITAS